MHGLPVPPGWHCQLGGIVPSAGAAGCHPCAVCAHASPSPVPTAALTMVRPAAGTGLAACTPACTCTCTHADACTRMQSPRSCGSCRISQLLAGRQAPPRQTWQRERSLPTGPLPGSPTAPDLCTNTPAGGGGEGIKWEPGAAPAEQSLAQVSGEAPGEGRGRGRGRDPHGRAGSPLLPRAMCSALSAAMNASLLLALVCTAILAAGASKGWARAGAGGGGRGSGCGVHARGGGHSPVAPSPCSHGACACRGRLARGAGDAGEEGAGVRPESHGHGQERLQHGAGVGGGSAGQVPPRPPASQGTRPRHPATGGGARPVPCAEPPPLAGDGWRTTPTWRSSGWPG